MAQLKSTSLLGNLTTTGTNLAAKFVKMGGTSSEFLMADGSTLTKSALDAALDSYPTTWTWTAGSTSGPTASITGTNLTAISVAAIPTATASASGIVTTGAQTFSGRKTFNGGVSSGADLIFPNVNHIVWNSGSYWQRLFITDDSESGTSVFKFQQSTNSGSSYSTLFDIYDNGKIAATTAALSGTTASTSTTTGALTVAGGVGIAGNLNVGGHIYVPENNYAYFGTDQLASFRANASGQFVVGSYGSMHFRASMNSNDSTTGDGFALTDASLYPETNKGLDLGSTSKYFSTVYGNHFRLDAGSLEKQYSAASDVPVIKVGVNNIDATLLKVYSNDQTYSDIAGLYGFSLKYIGTGNDTNNNLRLIADNKTSPKTAIDINQEGRIGINTNYSSSYYLNVNGNSNITGTLNVTSGATFGGKVNITNTTASTGGESADSSDGALVVAGGTVVKGKLVAAGGLALDNSTTSESDPAYYLTLTAYANGGSVNYVTAGNLKKQVIPATGNSYTPVYINSSNAPTACSVSSAGNGAANTLVVRSGAGQISAEKVAVTSSGTAKSYIQYNTTEECLEFIFA